MSDAILRFAPSPTGGFHVGNARTALFNFLYAQHYGGKLLLRVEDTDQKRYTEASLKTILEGLEWLGISFDGDPVFQTGNLAAHRRAGQALVDQGNAYRCYCTSEELEVKRQQALAAKQDVGYDGTCRELSPEEQAAREAQGTPYVVRFRVPDGDTAWNDRIRGVQRWSNREIGDFVILRADGSPTYQLAVVVDDHEMGVTLVIRGADHISNTPKQIQLFQALGWDVPEYAHNTLTLGSDGRKLSKRHGATTVTEYRDKGYLPDAVFNFLALLGWAPGDGQEVFTRAELAEAFTMETMLKKDSVFDEQKLEWLHCEHLRARPLAEVTDEAASRWISEGWVSQQDAEADRARLERMVSMLQVRITRYEDFRQFGYLFSDPTEFEEKARKKHWKADTAGRMEILIGRLEALEPFSEAKVEEVTRTLAGELGVSTGKLIHPTRLALSGVGFGPGLFELMEVLGRETCLRRLRHAFPAPGQSGSEAAD
jgi:glutamyl-tRNA synthetase